SDLKNYSLRLRLGTDYVFLDRLEWKNIKKLYTIDFRKKIVMDPTLMYDSVNKGEVDVITAYTSDGRIKKYDLIILEDDLKAIPPYHTLALLSPRALVKKPFLYKILQKLENKISLSTMQKLNYLVDEEGKTTKEAADIFLKELENK
ncbi:hypothetical protein OAK75_14210, partial [Bacteriovoracales bacterium]|nr:hypothetical protein [Bacteriovoracales bacterium]